MQPVVKHLTLILVVGGLFGVYRYNSVLAAEYHKHPDGTYHRNTECVHEVSISLLASSAEKEWLEPQVKLFNRENSGKVRVSIAYREGREALQNILNEKDRPVLWSPNSEVWVTRLADAYKEKNHQQIVNLADPSATRVYFRSPLVFLTTKAQATVLKPLLSGSDGWANLTSLSSGEKKLPGGAPFRFSHNDPVSINSGFLTLGLLLDAYHHQADKASEARTVAGSEGFFTHLKKTEKSLFYDDAAVVGTGTLTRAFAQSPKRFGVVITSEGQALTASKTNPDLAVLYPTPTANTENVVVRLEANWVTADQKKVADQFLEFLGSEDALKRGMETANLRPARMTESLSLNPTLQAHQAQGFTESYTAVELPTYDALNTAAFQWRRLQIAPAPGL